MTAAERERDPRAIVFRGGGVLPLAGDGRVAEALAVRDGRVLAVGTVGDAMAAAGRDVRVVDLAGATLMPGLIDTHPHLLHFAAREWGLVDLSDAVNHDDIVERVRARARVTPHGQWILCTPVGEPHYFIRRSWRDLEEGRLPDRFVLDGATTDHPVHIQAWAPTTPNVCAFNSAALAAIAISDFIPDRVCDVWIDKTDDGRVTGVLRGSVNNYYGFDPFWTQILLKMPGPATWELHDSTIAAMAAYNRQGVTCVYEGHNMRAEHIEAYRRLREENALTVRVMAAMEAETYAYPPFRPLSMQQFLANLERGLSLIELDDPMLKVTGVSFSPAAPLGPGLIRMHEPYEGPYGEMTTGVTFLSPEKRDAFIDFCARNAVRANFVVSGTRDTDDVIAGLAALGQTLDLRERRWLIQHGLIMTEAQARRLIDLGCDFTMSMSFSWGKGDLYGKRIGKHIWRDQVPLKRILRLGGRLGCGSDWGPKNAWELIALAETHEFCGSGHRNDGPDHALSRLESLLTWTRDAARVLGWDEVGALVPGAAADLIVVDGNPLGRPLDDLRGTTVHLTMVAGEPVWDDGVVS